MEIERAKKKQDPPVAFRDKKTEDALLLRSGGRRPLGSIVKQMVRNYLVLMRMNHRRVARGFSEDELADLKEVRARSRFAVFSALTKLGYEETAKKIRALTPMDWMVLKDYLDVIDGRDS